MTSPLPFQPLPPLILSMGEVLFDTFPHKRVMGGAPFNFFYHIHKLGYRAYFLSRIGEDDAGAEVLNFFKKKGLPLELLQRDAYKSTGEVTIEMKGSSHIFHIQENQAYDSLEVPSSFLLSQQKNIDLVYFGTLAQRSSQSLHTIRDIIARLKPMGCQIFLDLNLRAPYDTKAIILDSLKLCHILKLNDDELTFLGQLDDDLKLTHEPAVRKLSEKYDIETVCLTKGAMGAHLLYKRDWYQCPPTEVDALIDTVGAGDAFSACLIHGLLQKENPIAILEMASQFASKICQQEGAIPQSDDLYNLLLGEDN